MDFIFIFLGLLFIIFINIMAIILQCSDKNTTEGGGAAASRSRNTQSDYKIKPFYKLTEDEILKMSIIGSKPSNYSALGKGKPWDEEFIRKIIVYGKEDIIKTGYSHFAIVDKNGEICGFIGTHPFTAPNGKTDSLGIVSKAAQISVFIDDKFRGKGLVRTAVDLLVNEIRKHKNHKGMELYVLNAVDNAPAVAAFSNMGMKKIGIRFIYGKNHVIFKVDI